MKKIRLLFTLLIGFTTVGVLGAMDLSAIVQQAQENSSTIKTLQLNKRQTELTLGLSDLEEKIALSFDGTLTYNTVKYESGLAAPAEASFIVSPTLKLVLPNDGKTTLTLQAGPISKSFESTAFRVSPTIRAAHSFSLSPTLKTQNDLDDLKLSKQRLNMELGYSRGLLNFENSIYQKVIELLNYEKNILSLTDQISTQRQRMENALALRTMSEDSSSYRNLLLALNRSEASLQSAQRQLELAKKQYKENTGLQWEGIGAIPEADLSFTPLPTGDTSVLLATLDLEIATIELQLEEQKSGAKSLGISGEMGISNANNVVPDAIGYSLNAGSSLSANNFTLGANVDVDFSNTFKATPSFTISGSWRNDTAVETNRIRLQQLANSVELAVINQQNALQQYLESADALQSELLNYQIKALQREDDANYNEELLEQALERFARGLGTQDDVDGAKFTIELASYDQQIFQLEGLLLANKIKALRY